MNALRSEQLDQLKAFIGQRGFIELDLQYEILDHFACLVEEKMKSEQVSFEDAITQAHQEFGVFGFSVIEDASRKALDTQNINTFWTEVKAWIQFPRVLLFLGFGYIMCRIYMIVSWPVAYSLIILVYLFYLIFTVAKFRPMFRRYKNTLIMKSALVYMTVFPAFILQFSYHLTNYLDNQIMDPYGKWVAIISAFVTLLMVVFAFGAFRVLHYSFERCKKFELQYGLL